jgi:hypothetical protein
VVNFLNVLHVRPESPQGLKPIMNPLHLRHG